MPAMISFDGIILEPLSDPSEQLRLASQGVTVIETTSVRGDLQATGAGPKRVTVDPVDPITERTLSVRIVDSSLDVAQTLRTWQGRKVLYRDSSSRFMFAVFFGVRVVERLGEKGCSIYFRMTETGDTVEV